MTMPLDARVGWWTILKRTFKEVVDDNCLGLSAQLAYYFFLSLFPTLLVVVTLTSFFHRVWDSTEAKKHATTKDKWAQNWLRTHTADFGAWVSTSFAPNSELRLKAIVSVIVGALGLIALAAGY